MIKADDYIIESIIPNNIDIDSVYKIEKKLLVNEEIDKNEISKLLDYIISSVRSFLPSDANVNKSIDIDKLCQSLICDYLTRLNVMYHACMTQRVITNNIVSHSFVIVSFLNKKKYIHYLLDPTYNKFFTKNGCKISNKLVFNGMKIKMPDPGYFINDKDVKLIRELLSYGYIKLDEKSAKIYGDSFYYTKTKIPEGFKLCNMSGNVYLNSFLNGEEKLTKFNIGEIVLQSDIIRLKKNKSVI